MTIIHRREPGSIDAFRGPSVTTELSWRFNDMPIMSRPSLLASMPAADWVAQLKMNGWRAWIRWDGTTLSVISRHRKAIKVNPAVMARTVRMFREAAIEPCLIDGEYMGKRDKAVALVTEGFWFFDLLELEGVWLGNTGALARYHALRKLVGMDGRILLTETMPCDVKGNLAAFFDHSRTVPGCEGIVLKRAASRYIGSVRECRENPEWLKFKWRGGEDGNLPIA